MHWRLDILNLFSKRLYERVREKNPDVMISFAPNPYPWCEENLMQEWSQWRKKRICDLLAVQCYRYDADANRATVKEVLKHISASNSEQLFAPGMILMEGSNSKMSSELLSQSQW